MVFVVAMRSQAVWLTTEQARCLALAAEQVASAAPLAMEATVLGSLKKIAIRGGRRCCLVRLDRRMVFGRLKTIDCISCSVHRYCTESQSRRPGDGTGLSKIDEPDFP